MSDNQLGVRIAGAQPCAREIFILLGCENRTPAIPWSLYHVVRALQRLWNHTSVALLDATEELHGQGRKRGTSSGKPYANFAASKPRKC